MDNNRAKINSIQALRGLAAMMVVMFHYRTEINKTFPNIGDVLFINGSMGVDLFFLISGFIVYHVAKDLNDGLKSSKEFFIKRMCRIAPPYYLITLCVAGSSIDSWTETIKSLLFIPLDGSVTGPVYGYARLFVGWTLNYEFLFYCLCTFSILFRKLKWLILSLTIFSLTGLPSLFFGWNGLDPYAGYDFNITYLKLMTNPLILEFISGVFIGWLYYKNIKINNKLFWIILLISSIAFFMYIFLTGYLWGNSPKAFMIPCLFLLFSLVEYEKRYGIKWPFWVINTGTISFSIYLIHIQSLSITLKISKFLVKTGVIIPGVFIAFIALCLTILLAKLSYKYIEIGLSKRIKDILLQQNNNRI